MLARRDIRRRHIPRYQDCLLRHIREGARVLSWVVEVRAPATLWAPQACSCQPCGRISGCLASPPIEPLIHLRKEEERGRRSMRVRKSRRPPCWAAGYACCTGGSVVGGLVKVGVSGGGSWSDEMESRLRELEEVGRSPLKLATHRFLEPAESRTSQANKGDGNRFNNSFLFTGSSTSNLPALLLRDGFTVKTQCLLCRPLNVRCQDRAARPISRIPIVLSPSQPPNIMPQTRPSGIAPCHDRRTCKSSSKYVPKCMSRY